MRYIIMGENLPMPSSQQTSRFHKRQWISSRITRIINADNVCLWELPILLRTSPLFLFWLAATCLLLSLCMSVLHLIFSHCSDRFNSFIATAVIIDTVLLKKPLICWTPMIPYNFCFHLFGKEYWYPSWLQRKPQKHKANEPEKTGNHRENK